jgi:hypothetical protein
MDSIHSIMKDGGIARVCAQIVQKGSTTISEHEIVDAVSKIAVERYPELSEAQAFSKVYTASTDEARVLNSAIAVAKAMPFIAADTPLMVGGVDAMREANDATEASEAYRQLAALGQQRWPNERSDVQFSRAFGLRPDLAVKAHRRPSATTSFAFPR